MLHPTEASHALNEREPSSIRNGADAMVEHEVRAWRPAWVGQHALREIQPRASGRTVHHAETRG
jgi:hypothetical protein